MPKYEPYLIAQEFIQSAESKFNEIKELSSNEIYDLEYFILLDEIETDLVHALYLGDNNVCYKLPQMYDFIFEKFSGFKEKCLSEIMLRNKLVLLGRTLGIKECKQMDLIYNPYKTDKEDLELFYNYIQNKRENFNDKKLIDYPETIIITDKQDDDSSDFDYFCPGNTYWIGKNKICEFTKDGVQILLELVGNEGETTDSNVEI